jgi:hypothetical protein
MQYLKQFTVIIAISAISELLAIFIPLLFLLLMTGVLKLQQVGNAAHLLLGILPALFVVSGAGVIFAGIFGTVVSGLIFRIFKIEEPIAKGLALGAASHAMGTAESLKASELQGAMSSLAMVVSGVMMVGLIPLAALFVQ